MCWVGVLGCMCVCVVGVVGSTAWLTESDHTGGWVGLLGRCAGFCVDVRVVGRCAGFCLWEWMPFCVCFG